MASIIGADVRQQCLDIRSDCLEMFDAVSQDLSAVEGLCVSSDITRQLVKELKVRLWALRGALASAARLIELIDNGVYQGLMWRYQVGVLMNNIIIAEDGFGDSMLFTEDKDVFSLN